MRKNSVRKHTIIEAAIEVFGKKSLCEASISKIATWVSIAEGTMYQHFENKERS
jgi:AcrR family transcriptional regulator